ncbi:MAG: cytochrome b/b6 domain-containing protein [Paracoccaceae bacterium]|nr:cytochrome b/b6 domain-containing protein [Paracoccaceae bacterium]MDE3121850.1 cytochrome b/b6 domain-containing protein [Paracoccaceae bacterium]MDE3240785.1 cytochrome b/b6 domain-containing protein [Paracoccaceae bacterium]
MDRSRAYDPMQIKLHWTIAILIAAQFLLYRIVLPGWHYLITTNDFFFTPGVIAHLTVGTLVLCLVLWRLWLRRHHVAPPPPDGFDPRLEAIALMVQRTTYGLMILIPLSGLIAYFGNLQPVSILHNALAVTLLGLIGMHASGALYHQFVRHDGLMRRMRIM